MEQETKRQILKHCSDKNAKKRELNLWYEDTIFRAMDEYASIRCKPLFVELNYQLDYLGRDCPDLSNARSSIAEALSQYNEGVPESEEVTRDKNTKYTYYRVDYTDVGLEYDFTICESLDEVRDAINVVDTELDDPFKKASVKVAGIGLTPTEYDAWKADPSTFPRDEGVVQEPWISVEDRLPKTNEEDGFEQLVAFDEPSFGIIEKRINVGYFEIEDKAWFSELTGRELLRVTHWMPLPKPPAAEGKGEEKNEGGGNK